MDDINVKTVVSSKEEVNCSETAAVLEAAHENDVDPLAIDAVVINKEKDPLSVDQEEKKEDAVVETRVCDELDAKEINLEKENHEESESIALQSEKVKEDLIKEDNSPVNTVTDVIAEDLTTIDNDKKSPHEVPEEEENESIPPVIESKQLEPTSEEPVEASLKPEVAIVIEKAISTEKEVIPAAVEEVRNGKEDDKELDVEMTDKQDKTDLNVENKPVAKPVNGECSKDESTKRRSSLDIDMQTPMKKLCVEVEKTSPAHETMINDYIQSTSKNDVDEIQRHTEQLLADIQTLREVAQKKEQEWNHILHLKKVKEEILLRLLRRKQVLSFEKSPEVNGKDRPECFDSLNQPKNLIIDKSDDISGVVIKPGSTISPMMSAPIMPVTTHFPMSVLPPPYMQNMSKNVFAQPMMMPGPSVTAFPNGQMPNFGLPMGRQGPTKDVKSIIADYRQRNPDVTPRRGRRMKSILNPNIMSPPRVLGPKVDNMNNINNLGMIFGTMDMTQKTMLERLWQTQASSMPTNVAFKDVLVQFANMQPQPPPPARAEPPAPPAPPRRRPDKHDEVQITVKACERLAPSPRLPPPPPYPEISLLPVPSAGEQPGPGPQSSLLHGILTKQGSLATNYSPTLAKLLTSPERKQNAPTLPSFGQAKNCGEITITPVQPAEPAPATATATTSTSTSTTQDKADDVVQLDDEESAASDGEGSASAEGDERRLVIDEGAAAGAPGADEAPLCQGCRKRDAQFVCAGCANQWYCSRDCQVAAWDEHSDMCSG